MDCEEKQLGVYMAKDKFTVKIDFDTEFIESVLDVLETQDAIIKHYHKELEPTEHYLYLLELLKHKTKKLRSLKSII